MPTNYSHCIPILRNSTHFQGMEGILDNLLINCVLSTINLIIFIILKENAWRNQHDVLSLYKDGWISLLYRDVFDFIPPYVLQQMRCTYKPLDRNKTFTQMLWFSLFGLTTEDIRKRCGVDAVQYLKFLKFTIEYNLVNTAVVLLSIIPANIQGEVRKDENIFVRIMMDNLDFRQEWAFWIHVCVQTFLMIAGVIIIRNFSMELYDCKRSKWAKKSVVVKDISFKPLTSKRIEKYFRKILPQEEIVDIKIVYKYRQLINLNERLENAEEALTLCQLIATVEAREVYVKEICWCAHFWCYLSCKKYMVDGTEYYSNKIEHLKTLVATELSLLPLKIFKIAYVTFRYEFSAYQALTRKSQYPVIPDDKYWEIREAEDPANILWKSLTRRGSNYTLKTLLVNTAIILIAIFVSTPAIILSAIDLKVTSKIVEEKGPIFRYIPIFLTWILSVALPVLVTYSSGFLDFETKSGQNRSIMVKTVVFLIFVVVILPTLGLPSIGAFLIYSFSEYGGMTLLWRCLFLPGNGYFFVSYVMTAAFIGNIIQILRLPEVCRAVFGILISKSETEKIFIRRSCIWDFGYGVQYAHGLLILNLIMFYSLLIPIIAPAGLVYFLTKFAVDRYNICFAYSPSQASNKVHSLAIQFMIFALVMKPCGLLFFVYTRQGWSALTYASVTILGATLLVWFVSMNPLNLKFIPKCLLMPHRVSPHTPPHYYEEDTSLEREVYQPYEYRKYVSRMSPVDKYGNIIWRREVDSDYEDESDDEDQNTELWENP